MINFVEDLPPEWRSNWERLRSGENNSLNIRQCKHPFTFLNLPPWFTLGRCVEHFRQPRRGQLCEQPERKMPSASVAPAPHTPKTPSSLDMHLQLLIFLPGIGSKSYLEQKFDEKVQARCLKPLLGVIQSLVRFRPSDRISAAKALEMIASRRRKAKSRTLRRQEAK